VYSVSLRQLLTGDPRGDPESACAIVKFGDGSLDVVIDQGGGAALAFPSQTLYLGRDRGIDSIKATEAEASVHEWPKKHD
jgi:hypothetical protein